MEFTAVDYCAFIVYIVAVVVFAMLMSRKEESTEDYFLAGRKLTWWLIGISLIASNISTEHFVGMAGQGYEVGLAFASYEWTAAVAMVLVALFLLPRFLRRGIYTIPEYLESRYSVGARGLMAFLMMMAYILVIISAVLYAGALGLKVVFGLEMIYGVWLIGLIAGVYTVWGGLKAVVWADLFNGLGLILGGVVVTALGFLALGQKTALDNKAAEEGNAALQASAPLGANATDEARAAPKAAAKDKSATPDEETGLAWHQEFRLGIKTFRNQAAGKLSTVQPWNHPKIPWVAVFIGGLWIPQFFYWGLNQFIAQRALGAKSVAEGQKGIMFAACLKLLIPFIIIFPGIMAFELYAGKISDPDQAYPYMIGQILPSGLKGLMFAALFGAVMSSLDSMLNSASTIFTMDLYKRHLKKDAGDRSLITLGRLATAVFVILACLWAPELGWIAGGEGIFDYLQKAWGFVTPGVVTVFLFGLFSRRTPAPAACGAMLLAIPLYAFFLWTMPKVAFLHHMAFTFIALCGYMIVVTLLIPLRDVEESLPESDADMADGHSGLVRGRLIPFGTALIGAALLVFPIYQFSWNCLLGTVSWWVHFITAGVPSAIYVCVTIFLLRLPAPAVRRVAGGAPAPAGLGRLLKFAVIGLVGTVVLGLHTYMFCWEVKKDRYNPEFCYWQRSVAVTVPWIQLEEEDEDAAEGQPPADETGQPGPDQPEPQAEQPAAEGAGEEEAVEDNGVEEEKSGQIRIYYAPLAISLAVVLAFLAVLVLAWCKPVPPEVEKPPATHIDLTPSPLVKVWGIGVIAATAVLYYLFF